MEIRKEIVQRINSIEIPKDLIDVKIGYIPLAKGVVIKKVVGGNRVTKGGIILPDMSSTDTVMGRIMALGPECSEYLKVGLLVKYNPMTDIETTIKGEQFVLNTEYGIEGILVDEEIVITPKAKSSDLIRKEKKAADQVSTHKYFKDKDQNATDKYHESLKAKKSKIFPKSTKLR